MPSPPWSDSGRGNFSLDLYGSVDSPYWQVAIDKQNLRSQVTCTAPPQAELARAIETVICSRSQPGAANRSAGRPEAAAQGCVPVLAQSCGISEWMTHGVECLKAERTVEGFTQAFADVYDGNIDLDALGNRAANIVWRDFHIQALAPRIERILQETARKPRGQAGKPDEAYRLAMMAEKTAHILGQETLYV